MANEFISVKVGKLPGRIVEVVVDEVRTVQGAIEAAEIESAEGYEVRVNGAPASLTTTLAGGETVLLVRKIKGQRRH